MSDCIFQWAIDNQETLQNKYKAVYNWMCESGEEEKIKWLEERLKKYFAVSQNKNPGTLNAILAKPDEIMLNSFQFNKDNLEQLKKDQGEYFGVRVIFDGHFSSDHDFHYFAVNAGNEGVKEFGDYCLIFPEELLYKQKQVAVVFRNTLEKTGEDEWYFFDFDPKKQKPVLKVELLKGEVGELKMIKEIITIKNKEKYHSLTGKKEVGDFVLDNSPKNSYNNSDYVEVITPAKFLPKQIHEIRISGEALRYSQETTFDFLIEGEPASLSNEVKLFNEIKKKAEELNIKWVA